MARFVQFTGGRDAGSIAGTIWINADLVVCVEEHQQGTLVFLAGPRAAIGAQETLEGAMQSGTMQASTGLGAFQVVIQEPPDEVVTKLRNG